MLYLFYFQYFIRLVKKNSKQRHPIFKIETQKIFIFRHIYQNVSFFSYDFTPNIEAILPIEPSLKKSCTFEPENKEKQRVL